MNEKPEFEQSETSGSPVGRRDILKWTVFTATLLPTTLSGLFILFRYLLPKITLHEKRFRLAKVSELPPEGIEARVKGTSFVVVKQGENIRAFSTVCTHLGCKVTWKPDLPGFYCPCHDGYFDADGQVTAGPPPSPLEEYPIEIDKDDVYIRLILT